MPDESRRIMLARSISRWLTTSASAGTSFCVAMKNFEVFMRQHRHCLYRWAVEKSIGSDSTLLGGAAHAGQGRLPSERRHHPRQRPQRGFLGQAGQPARLAVPPGRHPARRDPAAGHVPRAGGGDRPAASAREDPRPHARVAALRGAGQVGAAHRPRRRGLPRRVPRPEADLVPAAPRRARLRREAARERTPRIRRLALARLLGSARHRDRFQARGVSPGADRAAPLPAVRPPPAAAAPGVPAGLSVERDYSPLPIRELGADAGFRRPVAPQAARVAADSPALQVMTDLARVAPATIRPQAPLAGANQFMITRGVRLLLVLDELENVLGVITATDLLGEKPMMVATQRGLRRDELTVADIMVPAGQVEVIALADVENARVGHVLATLRRAGRQHALVVDEDVSPAARPLEAPVRRIMVRGIFSISQIARQLGVALPAGGEVARTFSEIEAAIR